jgi:hypothetical protein
MFCGLFGLTAIVVSFCAALQPVCEPTGTTVSPTIWSTLGAGSGYGLGWPRKSWQSALRLGASCRFSFSSLSNCFSSRLCRMGAAAAGVPPVATTASAAIRLPAPMAATRRANDRFTRITPS